MELRWKLFVWMWMDSCYWEITGPSLEPKPENMAFHRSLRSTVLQLIDELNERELGRTIALLLLAMEQPIILRF